MQDTTTILQRSNIKYNIVIQYSILILCSMVILIGIFAIQRNKEETKKTVAKKYETENKKTTTQKEKNKLTAGVSRYILEFSKEPLQETEVETLDIPIVTDTIDTEPEIIYKSLKEVEISRDMDLTEHTYMSKKEFCKSLENFKYDYAGFYKRNADLIWDLSQKYQVNEIFICGVFALESYYGSDERHINTHNYGSIMTRSGDLVKYETDKIGIEANFKLFANCYLNPKGKYHKGVTVDSIGDTYCPPTSDCPSWADKIYECMQIFLKER